MSTVLPPAYCGVTYTGQSGLVYLPLEQVDIHADIVDISATVTLTQAFWQWAATPTSTARYVFPVPAQAAVCGFEMRTEDGRVVTAVAKEREAARKDFQQAIRQDRMAGLVEHATDDVFVLSLGRLPKSQIITTKLTYIMDLAEGDFVDQLRFHIPKYVGSRYGPSPAWDDRPKKTLPYCVKLTVDVYMKGAISSIWSPSHPTLTVLNDGKRQGTTQVYMSAAQYAAPEFLLQDFVLYIKSAGLNDPRCFAESGPAGAVALQLTIVPEVILPCIPAQEYIFLVDRSYSMLGNRIETAKRGLAMLLRALPARGTWFNILSFGSAHDSLWELSKSYDALTLEEATKHIDSMTANYGGTEIQAALNFMFGIRSGNLPTSCFVLTDGEAFDIDSTIESVKRAVSQAKISAPLRVFTLGIGETSSTAMCNGIARAGNGVCLMAATSETIIAKTTKLVKAAKTEYLQNITIDWGVSSRASCFARWFRISRGSTIRQGPRTLPLLYNGVRLTVFAIVKRRGYKLPNEITIQAQRSQTGEVARLTVAVERLEQPGSLLQTKPIHTLAARRIIQDLDDRFGRQASTSAKETIVQLGQQYQLATRFTAFIAVEGERQETLGAIPLEEKVDDNSRYRSAFLTSVSHGASTYAIPPVYDVTSSLPHEDYSDGDRESYGMTARRAFIPTTTPSSHSSGPSALSPSAKQYSLRSEYCFVDSVPSTSLSAYQLPPMSFQELSSGSSDSVEQLARLQSFDGSFSESTEFLAIFGTDAVDAGHKHKLEARVWTTILGIAYLQKHLAYEPGLLQGLIEKAVEFVRQVHEGSLESLLNEAREFVP